MTSQVGQTIYILVIRHQDGKLEQFGETFPDFRESLTQAEKIVKDYEKKGQFVEVYTCTVNWSPGMPPQTRYYADGSRTFKVIYPFPE
jgi:hypothetical protein